MSKKQAYLLVIFGISLVLFTQRAYYIIYSVSERLLNLLPLPGIVTTILNFFIEIIVFAVVFLFVYLNLPQKINNLNWLKSSIVVLLIGFIVFDLITTGINLFRYSSFGDIDAIMHLLSRVIRGFVFELIIFIVLLLLTFRIYSTKEKITGPPPLRRH
jgi:hypothetical protein